METGTPPRRSQAMRAVTRARERGQLRADVDGEVILDLVFGPIHYRLLTGHAPLDDSLVEVLVNAVVDGLAPTGSAHGRPTIPRE